MLKGIRKQMNKKGFTLIELVVVIAILAILAAIAVPQLIGFQDRAKEQADKQTAAQVKNSLALLYANNEAVPELATATFTIEDDGGLSIAAGYTDGDLSERTYGAGGVESYTDLTAAQVEALLTDLIADFDIKSDDKHIEVSITVEGAVSANLITPVVP